MRFEEKYMRSLFSKREKKDQAKCAKCGTRPPTKEDHLCDSCRYSQIMDNIIVKSKEEKSVLVETA